MNLSIKGQTVLITGANRGIGRELLASCINHGASKVYAGVRTPATADPLVFEYGQRVVPLHVDLCRPETIAAAARVADDVDVVVSNAGILKMAGPLDAHALETLREEMEVNVYGLLRMARAFAPVLAGNGGPRSSAFVQLNSVASLKSFPGFATYCASKAAAYSLTQALRETLGARGIHVLSVHPGPIATDMADDAGFNESAEPASVVAEGILQALDRGDFHLFPDSMAQRVGGAYAGFAEQIVEADLMEA